MSVQYLFFFWVLRFSFYFVILSYLFWQKLLIAFVLNDPKVDKRSWLGEAAWRSALKGSLSSHIDELRSPSPTRSWALSFIRSERYRRDKITSGKNNQRQHYTTLVSAPVRNNKFITNSGIVRTFLYCFNICARGIKVITAAYQSTSWSLFYYFLWENRKWLIVVDYKPVFQGFF